MHKLTRLQRRILLAALDFEEMQKRTPILFKIHGGAVPPSMIALQVFTHELKDKRVKTDSAESWLTQMVAQGAMSAQKVKNEVKSHEEKVKQCMKRMAANNLLLEVIRRVEGKHRTWYKLSPLGRSIAVALRYEKMDEDERGKLLEKALEKLRDKRLKEGQPALAAYATADEILEELLSLTPEIRGAGEVIFRRIWNRRKLAKEMRKRGYRLIQQSVNSKRMWFYDLSKPYAFEEKLEDLKRALDEAGMPIVSTREIREALWKVCGHKFGSKAFFEKEWSVRKIGRLMRKLGARRFRKWYRGQKGASGWYYDLRPVFPDRWPRKITPPEPVQFPFSFTERSPSY
ncbi:MAG: hypothetical protein QXH00_06410 [Candidatus Jordarchaeales archaeon]